MEEQLVMARKNPIQRRKARNAAAYAALSGETKGLKRLLPFIGPAFIAAVAYIDPGNFATNITAGSKYGYLLLWVIAFSNLMAGLIQSLSAKLGIATGKNLPEMIRERFSHPMTIFLWVQSEIVIMATDLAEFIGASLGIYLVFHIPMIIAALITAIGSFLILELQRRGYRSLEVGIAGMVLVVVIAFAFQVLLAKPDMGGIALGLFIPRFQGVETLLLSAGILGATVMPHAIYLHSSLTQRRVVGRNDIEKKQIFRFEFVDIAIAMVIAGAINMSMLIVAAAFFNKRGLDVEDLGVAFNQFSHLSGTLSALLFGIGLMIAGLSSSSVGTLSGDVVMQGFIRKHISLYLRRAITMIPPLLIILLGINPTYALILSQVILSFGIAFALVPLIIFTADKKLMGNLTNHPVTTFAAWVSATLIILLNFFLLYQSFFL